MNACRPQFCLCWSIAPRRRCLRRRTEDPPLRRHPRRGQCAARANRSANSTTSCQKGHPSRPEHRFTSDGGRVCQKGWNPNKHMLPDDPGSLGTDLKALLEASQKGPAHVSDAEWILPPSRGNPRQVVGYDHPNKAKFNEPRRDDKLLPRRAGIDLSLGSLSF